MITKEAIEAAARAACEDNVQRIHKAAHDSGSSASMSGSEYYMYPPHGWPDFLASMEAAIAAAFAAMPGPAVKVKPLEWVEHWGGSNDDLPSWRGKNPLGLHVSVDFIGKYNLDRHSDAPQDELETAKAAAQADYEARILSAHTPAPDIASENERLRAALGAIIANHETVGAGASIFQCTTAEVNAARTALERT